MKIEYAELEYDEFEDDEDQGVYPGLYGPVEGLEEEEEVRMTRSGSWLVVSNEQALTRMIPNITQ
jgi:hypothetical protein